ncbi:MAG: flagellar motor protein MotB [Vicinamibacterales bacterium]|nr:flagellar motor protein MotB [Vicinamibacterales bacterium]
MEHAPHSAPVRRERRRRQESHGGHERWLVSYADFITLLFAFFTMMYAMSTVDAQKFKAIASSMQVAFDKGGGAPPAGLNAIMPADKGVGEGGIEDGMAALQQQMTERLAEAIALNQVGLERDGRGLVISIREAGSFGVGSADLSTAAADVLARIGEVLATAPHAVRVEGHTDNVPINTARFRSNWELSTARATNVIAYLVQQQRVDARRMSASGYGEFHPRVPNDDEAGRARNRRVDIVVLNPDIARAQEPALMGEAR